jgi:apoptotic chromatin condensation inducer in the nucleus
MKEEMKKPEVVEEKLDTSETTNEEQSMRPVRPRSKSNSSVESGEVKEDPPEEIPIPAKSASKQSSSGKRDRTPEKRRQERHRTPEKHSRHEHKSSRDKDRRRSRDRDSTRKSRRSPEKHDSDEKKSEKTGSLSSRWDKQKESPRKKISESEHHENEKENSVIDEEKTSISGIQQQRKRRWLSRKISESKSVIAITTDSLKNIISDVQVVPLSDVKLQLESSPEPESSSAKAEPVEKRPRNDDKDLKKLQKEKLMERLRKQEEEEERRNEVNAMKFEASTGNGSTNSTSLLSNRKVAIVVDDGPGDQSSPPRYNMSCILYITNLVRPFTVLQLKGLLARTGKIVENGFWIDKIKSKCYVKYETEE